MIIDQFKKKFYCVTLYKESPKFEVHFRFGAVVNVTSFESLKHALNKYNELVVLVASEE